MFAVDEDRPRRPGRFLLTGSANLLLMENVAESLAGRAGYVNLWPLTRGELLGRGSTGVWDVFKGRITRFLDHLRTYLERDLQQLASSTALWTSGASCELPHFGSVAWRFSQRSLGTLMCPTPLRAGI